MSFVYAIDPGPAKSAGVILNGDYIVSPSIMDNDLMLQTVRMLKGQYPIAIEMIASYGMPVGREVFDTCVWIGRFIEAAQPRSVSLIYRKDVKMHLCGTVKAKDPNIRQALLDRYGCVGTKKNPGKLYGVSKDIWAALAVAVTHNDRELRKIEGIGGRP
jgi:hypothetical protein